MSITVAPFGDTRVTVPYRVSFERAVEFASSKADWIKKHLEKTKQYQQECRSELVAAWSTGPSGTAYYPGRAKPDGNDGSGNGGHYYYDRYQRFR